MPNGNRSYPAMQAGPRSRHHELSSRTQRRRRERYRFGYGSSMTSRMIPGLAFASKGNGSMQEYRDRGDAIKPEELIRVPLQGANCYAWACASAGVIRRRYIRHCAIIECSPVIEPKGSRPDPHLGVQQRSCCHRVRVLESRTANQPDHIWPTPLHNSSAGSVRLARQQRAQLEVSRSVSNAKA